MREINLHKLDEEQLIALITSALAITDKTNVPPEEVIRSIKALVDKGLISVIQRRTDTGRLEVGFQLHID